MLHIGLPVALLMSLFRCLLSDFLHLTLIQAMALLLVCTILVCVLQSGLSLNYFSQTNVSTFETNATVTLNLVNSDPVSPAACIWVRAIDGSAISHSPGMYIDHLFSAHSFSDHGAHVPSLLEHDIARSRVCCVFLCRA
jgi:hypothetical protein